MFLERWVFGKHDGAEIFGNVIGVAIDDAGLLPAHEMTLRVFAKAVDAIEIGAPHGAVLDALVTDRLEWDARGGVPDVVGFVDAALVLEAGVPFGAVSVVIEIDSKVDPIAGGSDFEFAIVADVLPVVAEEKFDDVFVPELEAIFAVVGREPEIQDFVRGDEEEIEIGVGPEAADFGFEVGIAEFVRAILFNPCR